MFKSYSKDLNTTGIVTNLIGCIKNIKLSKIGDYSCTALVDFENILLFGFDLCSNVFSKWIGFSKENFK
ncbi:hypothetical protein ER70_08355 (plasmid) [Borreliella bissettiae]|uniref:Uncharacterized protein n=1 Tax=Borrelia bissettiae TaxID=64897 RepID=A0A1L8Z9T7_BORBI|nr:hypothetical protein ER70_08355 [Borreliella bissettiae]